MLRMIPAILAIFAAYLLGAIPFGYLIAKWRGVDIFAHGSGNIGATNVGRVLGRKFGVLVFALDFAKGALAVLLVSLWDRIPILSTPTGLEFYPTGTLEVGAGMSAFVGHLFPIYLRFRGGKGVATGAGVVVILLPIPALVGLAVWIVIVAASRLVALASIAAVVVLCAVHLRQPASWSWTEPRTWFCLIAGGLVIVRHHANIVRLFKGTENQLEENAMLRQLNKSLHVLALGLWFGMSIFFSFVVANVLFSSFQTLAESPQRESWFPQPAMYRDAPKELKNEQGTRAAGYAIGPMFTWYFALQGVCGFIALATALAWTKLPGEVHRWRVNLLLTAVILVLIGWVLERKVHELRVPRNQTTEACLRSPGNAQLHEEMDDARRTFLHWHLASIALNLATIACVTAAMALAGNLEGAATPAKTN